MKERSREDLYIWTLTRLDAELGNTKRGNTLWEVDYSKWTHIHGNSIRGACLTEISL